MFNENDLFKAGHFVRPHGIKGEIGIVVEGELPQKDGAPFFICEIDRLFIPFFIEYSRSKTKAVRLVKIYLVDTADAARAFTGKDIYYPRTAVGIAKQNIVAGGQQIAWSDLTGYTVYSLPDGNEIGIIEAIDDSTPNILLRVVGNSKKYLIPAVAQWVLSLDPVAKRLHLSLPDGLLDIA